MKVSNPYAANRVYSHVQFRHSGTCTQTEPGGAKDWYVCIRPAAGKSCGNLDNSSENCTKP